MLAILTGLLAGAFHVVSGPDHLAAVAPLAVQDRRAWRSGLRWGLGHAGGVFVVGVLALLLRGLLPLDLVSSWAERLVGVVLMAIGFWGIRMALAGRLHAHVHAHGTKRHLHLHMHRGPERHSHEPRDTRGVQSGPERGHQHSHAAFFVGTLHGVAGTSHLLGVLPALAFPHWAQTVSYLCAFGLGTLLAMAAFAAVLGWLGQLGLKRGPLSWRGLLLACSVTSVVVGVFWLGQ